MKPTPEQLEEFDGFLKKWQIALGLQDWDVYRSPKLPAKAHTAEMESDIRAKQARVVVGEFGAVVPINAASLEELALHELLHTFLAELAYVCAKSKDWDLRMNAEHRIIHTLCRLLLKEDK